MATSRRRLIWAGLVSIWLGAFTAAAADPPQPPKIDADFSGGNIVVERIEGDTVFLRPDLRDTQKGQWWFWWNFRVRDAGSRLLHFRFSGRNPIGVRGPAVSQDGGLHWSWMGAKSVWTLTNGPACEFTWDFRTNAAEARFAFAIPYQEADLLRFLDRHRTNTALVQELLCTTKKGRRVELLRLGRVDGQAAYRVLITARHHACECLASYALEGLLESVLAEDEEGRRWRSEIELLAVPFVDKDGVEDGDQGKNRAPHDHNRDYSGTSIYASVAALRECVPSWSQGRLRVALDLHCPYIRGEFNEQIYFVGSQDQENWLRVVQLAALLEQTQTGPLRYQVRDNLSFETAWNTEANYGGGKSFAAWARELPDIRVASTIELPYANARGQEVNAESARAFGRDLARAVLRQVLSME